MRCINVLPWAFVHWAFRDVEPDFGLGHFIIIIMV